MKEQLTIHEFFMIYADLEGWEIPNVHFRILDFLEGKDDAVNNTLQILCHRGIGKSTIIGIIIAYWLYVDNSLRIMAISADNDKAVKITRHVLGVINRHPLTCDMIDGDNRVREKSFWINNNTDDRTPSVSSYGIDGNVTSIRADIIIYDDVESPNNSNTTEKREILRERIAETFFLLAPQKRLQVFIGTPHSEVSIYDEHREEGCTEIIIPLFTDMRGEFPNYTGTPSWPEVFNSTYAAVCQKKAKRDKVFLAQYQIQSLSLSEGRLNPALLVVDDYEVTTIETPAGYRMFIDKKEIVSVSTFWDVSSGGDGSDDSVLTVCYITDDGHYYFYLQALLTGEILEQCEEVKLHAHHYQVPSVIIETNGIGHFTPTLLRKEMSDSKIAITGHHSKRNKLIRILEAFTVPLSAGLIHINRQVQQGKLIGQIRDLSDSGNSKDDYVDCAASCILQEPIRLLSQKDRNTTRSKGGLALFGRSNQGTYTSKTERKY